MKFFGKQYPIIICLILLFSGTVSYAQWNLNQSPDQYSLQHGIRQFEDGHFVQAIHTLENYLKEHHLAPAHNKKSAAPDLNKELATYYIVLSKILYGSDDLETVSENYIQTTVNTVHRDRACYYLAHHYFLKGDYAKVIEYYDLIDIKNLDNNEIADAKFEQAYAYFIESDFDRAYPYFAAIKELEDNTYFFPGNYYFGLLAYHRGNYDAALTSFNRIIELPEYKEFIPYYNAEIYYYKGDYDKVLEIAGQYITQGEQMFYYKEMQLLTGQVHFERKKYKEALPYLKYYYKYSDKVSKETLYELAFTNYQLQDYTTAISLFKQLSGASDSLGQNSMYLLGDAYIKTQDKQGAMNAFSIASSMDYNQAIQETSQFLYAKLAYELGDDLLAIQSFRSYIEQHPNGNNITESKQLIVSLLSKSKDYESAFNILSEIDLNTAQLQNIYQKVCLGRAMDLWKNNDFQGAAEMLDHSLKYKNDKPVFSAAQFWRAYLYYEQKNYTASANMMKEFIKEAKTQEKKIKAVSKEASLENAYTHLGYAEMALEKYGDAQKSFTEAGNKEGQQAGAYKETETNTILQADAAFMAKDYEKAYTLYENVIVNYPKNAAYAIYQKALIAGVKSNPTEKKTLLQKVIKDYPETEWKQYAEYELGNTYLEEENWKESKEMFSKLSKGTDTTFNAKALLKLAYVSQKTDDYKSAIQQYETFMTTYRKHPETQTALKSLNFCYMQIENPDGFVQFLKGNGLDEFLSEVKIEDNYYQMAENKYIEQKYVEAIPLYDQYISKFPKGEKITEAYFYKGESLMETKDLKGAETAFNQVYNGHHQDYKLLAALRLAEIAYDLKEYPKAIEFAEAYIDGVSNDELQVSARIIRMKAYHKDGLIEDAGMDAYFLADYIDQLSKEDLVSYKLCHANYIAGTGAYEQADGLYQEVIKAQAGSLSAEARYRRAEILLKQNKLKEAEELCDQAIQENSGDFYWKVKSYILIAEILGAQKDYFNARATLNSVIQNANNKDLEQEAIDVLRKIDAAEQEESKINNQ